MKIKILSTLLLAVMLVTAQAQIRKIPSEVTDGFKAKFPNASHVTWKDKLSNFTAEFEQKNENAKATFNSKGEWQRTEKALTYSKLPSPVKDGFTKSKYAKYPVKEVIETDDHEKGHLYQVIVKRGDITKRNLVFTTEGQLVKDEVNF